MGKQIRIFSAQIGGVTFHRALDKTPRVPVVSTVEQAGAKAALTSTLSSGCACSMRNWELHVGVMGVIVGQLMGR